MTKEEILKGNYEKVFYPQKYESKVNRKLTESFALPAMDEYAKQEAIAFAQFRDDYKRAESDSVHREQVRLGGMITWKGADDEIIYKQFLASLGCKIKFRQQVWFKAISEESGEFMKEGRAVKIDYIDKVCVVEHFNKGTQSFEYTKFELYSLFLEQKK